MVEFEEIDPGETVLDIGTGTGAVPITAWSAVFATGLNLTRYPLSAAVAINSPL
jgi:cyclopropane fatty-acyl-phospholipid synthase-like methyltransferase